MKYSTYQESVFRSSVSKALQQVKSILDTTRRHVRLANGDEVHHHVYNDKYLLAETMTNTTLASLLACLNKLGLTAKELQQFKSSSDNGEGKNLTLRFESQDGCYFLKEQEVEVVSSTPEIHHHTTTTNTAMDDMPPGTPGVMSSTGSIGVATPSSSTAGSKTSTTRSTTRIVQKVKEYHWRVETSYRIVLLVNGNEQEAVELQKRSASTIIVTTGNSGSGSTRPTPMARQQQQRPGAPIPDKTIHPAIDVNITYLLSVIEPQEEKKQEAEEQAPSSKEEEGQEGASLVSATRFAIDRENPKTCKTPRRNLQIHEALEFVSRLEGWMNSVRNAFVHRIERRILGKHRPTSNDNGDNTNSKSTLEIGTLCALDALLKEPRLNGKLVIVREHDTNDRYRVEPANPTDGLPPSLLVKRMNLKVEPNQPAGAIRDGPPLSKLQSSEMLVPVVPVFMQDEGEDEDAQEVGNVMLTPTDVNTLLKSHTRSLNGALDKLAQLYPPRQLTKLVSTAEATIVLISMHVRALRDAHRESVNFIEGMLTQQLVSAIGKEVSARDFDQYMRFYLHKKLFRSGLAEPSQGREDDGLSYAPRPFTYSVRRPNHYPDGMLSIELSRRDAEQPEPIDTVVRKVTVGDGAPSIFMPLNAATSIEMVGDLYLHGWMQHIFLSASSDSPKHHLVARARQFSSFMVLVGTMAGATQFEPKHAIILQNKDEVLIPLLTQVLPTAREFQDSIASLSPEQQEFAKAYRAMQLESSVFGVVVVQIKPQMEKLLRLPSNSLTKEIELTQDLMSLFCEYQIPSDLLSFDGPEDASLADKLASVKGYVQSVTKVIEASKEKQLIEEERKADMRWEMASDAMDSMAPTGGAFLAQSMGSRSTRGGVPRKERAMAAVSPVPAPGAMMAFGSAAKSSMVTTNYSAASSHKPQFGVLGRGGTVVAPSSAISRLEDADDGAAADAATAQSTTTQSQEIARSQLDSNTGAAENRSGLDFTLIPKILDAKVEAMGDADNNSLRTTIIKAGTTWKRSRQENLLTRMKSSDLGTSQIDVEKNKAFDLLDALSRSGTLPIDCAELHVVVGMSHCFENDVMGTVIQDNINPIEKVERSALVLASAIHGIAPDELVKDKKQLDRLAAAFPKLFIENERES